MKNDDIRSKIFYVVVILILIWGILGSLYLAGIQLLGAIGSVSNWEFAKQFSEPTKGFGVHLFSGLFLVAISGFLAWMGQKFLNWVNEDSRKRKATKYKRRNYR